MYFNIFHSTVNSTVPIRCEMTCSSVLSTPWHLKEVKKHKEQLQCIKVKFGTLHYNHLCFVDITRLFILCSMWQIHGKPTHIQMRSFARLPTPVRLQGHNSSAHVPYLFPVRWAGITATKKTIPSCLQPSGIWSRALSSRACQPLPMDCFTVLNFISTRNGLQSTYL